MSPLETFFAFGFVSTFAVVILATLWYYLPTVTALYSILIQPSLEVDSTLAIRKRKAASLPHVSN